MIVQELKNSDISWNDIKTISDETVDNVKMNNTKRKAASSGYPTGHAFEAVAEFKSRVSERDPYFVFSLNDRKMNGEISYVIKSSKVQLRLACAMAEGFLKNEYCFCDGTHKRCPDFVTLGVFVFVPVLKRIVKICSMEAESESSENWAKLWTLFNLMIKGYSNDPLKRFNPTGWVCDGGGLWCGIRDVFGAEAIKKP